MDRKSNKDIKTHGYDFMRENELLFFIEGYAENRGILYIVYIFLIYAFNSFLIVESIYGAYLVAPDKELIIDALHVFLIAVFALWGLSARLIVWRPLKKVQQYILDGFYEYSGEEPDPEETRMRESVAEDVRTSSLLFLRLFLSGALSNIIFFPISQYILVSDEDYEKTVDIANPYLPHFFHLPFSTRSPLGFWSGFMLNILLLLYIYGMAVAMNRIYISTLIQFKVQLEILNHSIRNVHKRAYLVYLRKHGLNPMHISEQDLYDNKEYQKCLNRCLRSNIVHHQTLLKYHIDCQAFNGSCILIVSLIASMIFASLLYLIMKNPPLNYLINYIISLLTEQSYAFYTCYFGELVLQQSSDLFESLYSIQWYKSNKEFNKLLGIFMCYTMKPIRVKTLLLDLSASLKSFGDFMSAMYKIMSLLRQSDK